MAIVWCVVWLTCIAESPSEDKYITKEELKYIVDSIGPIEDKKSKRVLHSLVYAGVLTFSRFYFFPFF